MRDGTLVAFVAIEQTGQVPTRHVLAVRMQQQFARRSQFRLQQQPCNIHLSSASIHNEKPIIMLVINIVARYQCTDDDRIFCSYRTLAVYVV